MLLSAGASGNILLFSYLNEGVGICRGVGEHAGMVAEVAIKMLRDPTTASTLDFLKEAQILIMLNHPNIIR